MATLTIADLDNGKRDLQTVSEVANSKQDTTLTRFGQAVPTLWAALRALGYAPPVAYALGINVDSPLFTIERNGVVYSPVAGSTPFVTGPWDASKWRPIQDSAALQAHITSEDPHPQLTDRIFTSVSEAEAARDAALVGAQLYATEADGRASVSDGQTFNVQGSGDVAAYQYRRVNATSSTLIATFPSAAAVQRNTDALSEEKYAAGYSDPLPVPPGTNSATGLILLDWPVAKGTLTSLSINASASGSVNVSVYSKSGDTFTLVRQQRVTVPSSGYHVLALRLPIDTNQYLALSGDTGTLTYSAARADGNGWRSGTPGPSFTQATVNTTTRIMARVNVSVFTGHDSETDGILDRVENLESQTLTGSAVQVVNNSAPFSEPATAISAAATFLFETPVERSGSVVFECRALTAGNAKILVMEKKTDGSYLQKSVINVSLAVGENAISVPLDVEAGDYLALRSGSVGYRSEPSLGVSSFFTQNFVSAPTFGYSTNIAAGFKITSKVAGASGGSRDHGTSLPWEFMFVPSLGHSLIEGSRTGDNGQPFITTSQEFDSVAFPAYPAAPASLAPATVANSQRSTYTARGEWSGLGAAAALRRTLARVNSVNYLDTKSTVIVANNGVGGAKIADVSRGTAQYDSVVAQAAALSTVAQGSSGVAAVMLGIGENDSEVAAFLPALRTLVSDLDADLRGVTGQTKQIPVVAYQMSTQQRGISLHQLTVARSHPLFVLACPGYIFDYYDNIHITAASERILGAYLAEAVKSFALDGVKPSQFEPVACDVISNTITLTYDRNDLVLDAAKCPLQTNFGFTVSGNTITSVSVLNGRQVRIVCGSAVAQGSVVSYGAPATGKGTYVGRGGNLRDQKGDAVSFDGIPLHNAALEFDWMI